jgi:cytochrome P450
MNRSLSPRTLSAKREWIEATCEKLADRLAEREQPDLISDFTAPFAYSVLLGLFGSPLEHIPVYEQAADAFFVFWSLGRATPEAALEYERALAELSRALESVYDYARERPDDTVIGSLLVAEEDGRLDSREMFAILAKFFASGQENLIYTPAVAMLQLLRHPDQLELVRADPTLAAAAFEEAVRFDPPAQLNPRGVAADTELGGALLRRGDEVAAVKAAANRDPAAWTDADRFDITRDQNEPPFGSVSFGQGIHFCIGAGVARLVGATAVAALVRRFPEMRLPDGWQPAWRSIPLRRQLTELPVVLQ